MAEPKRRKLDILSGLEQLKRLSEEDLLHLLQSNYAMLVDKLELRDGLLTILYSRQIVSGRQKQTIQCEVSEFEQVETLLDILMRKDKGATIGFFQALIENDQEHMLKAIIRTYEDSWRFPHEKFAEENIEPKESTFTNENNNYARLDFLVTDVGTKAVRGTFDQIPMFVPIKLKSTLQTKKNELFMKKTFPNYLHKELFPVGGKTSSDFDLTMMNSLMLNLCKQSEAKQKAIKQIKDKRNHMAHSNDVIVKDNDFNSHWTDIEKAIRSLANNSYDGRMKVIKAMTLVDGDQQMTSDQTDFKEAFLNGALRKNLKNIYRSDEMSHIRSNPLNPKETKPIASIYVKLALVAEDVNIKAGQKIKMMALQHYSDIFGDQSKIEEEKIHRIVIQGKPGVGKSTFSKRLAFDWTEGKGNEISERFENVFVLSLRKVTLGQNLIDIIKEQLLLPTSPLVPYLKTYIEKNSEKCLFVLDGLDEMKQDLSQNIENMIKGYYLRKACVLVTTRPIQAQHLSTTFDRHARIEGFTEENMEEFITNSLETPSTSLLNEIRTEGLIDIAQIPLILSILCSLYKEHKSLPKNVYKIYQGLQQLLSRRKRHDNLENEAKLRDVMDRLGEMAFEGLIEDNEQLLFSKQDILQKVGDEAFMVGLLWKEEESEAECNVSFLHKSFQEYSAAFYLAQKTEIGENDPWKKLEKKMEKAQDVFQQDLLLQFCGGGSQKLGKEILDFLDKKVKESDVILKTVLRLMENLSQNQDLSQDELETVCNYDYTLQDDVKEIIELEAKCLSNIENQNENETHAVHQIIYDRKFEMVNVKRAIEHRILKPEKCISFISNDGELENLVDKTESVSWIKLEGKRDSPFSFTEKTVSLLQDLSDRDKQKHKMGVCIGEWCKADCAIMTKVIKRLKEDSKYVKYTQFTLGTDWHPYNMYTKEGLEELFEELLEISSLFALNLSGCDIPDSLLKKMGKLVNQNAETLLQLDLAFNPALRKRFVLLGQEIKEALPLTVLKLRECLDPLDTKAFSCFLNKCQQLKILDIYGCECPIGNDILKLRNLVEIDISRTVNQESANQETANQETGRGFDVGQFLENLDKVPKLEVLTAKYCNIDDTQIQKIPLNVPSKIRKIDFGVNSIDGIGLMHLCKQNGMKETVTNIGLQGNKIGDNGAQAIIKLLKVFKKMRWIGIDYNRMSESMKTEVEKACDKHLVYCDIGQKPVDKPP